jgi:hypothetical protein
VNSTYLLGKTHIRHYDVIMPYIENSYTIFANVIRTYKVSRIFPGQLELRTNDNRSQALFWQMKDWYKCAD